MISFAHVSFQHLPVHVIAVRAIRGAQILFDRNEHRSLHAAILPLRAPDLRSFALAHHPPRSLPPPEPPRPGDAHYSWTTARSHRLPQYRSPPDLPAALPAVRDPWPENLPFRKPAPPRRPSSFGTFVSRTRKNFVIGAVQRGPDQIVHGGVDDHEFFVAGFFPIKHARQQHARRRPRWTGRARSWRAARDPSGAAHSLSDKCRKSRAWPLPAYRRRPARRPDPRGGYRIPSRAAGRSDASTRSTASITGAGSINCDPIWQLTPSISRFS